MNMVEQINALRECRADFLNALLDLRRVAAIMREHKVNSGKSTSPTLVGWADRIDRDLDIIGVPK